MTFIQVQPVYYNSSTQEILPTRVPIYLKVSEIKQFSQASKDKYTAILYDKERITINEPIHEFLTRIQSLGVNV